MPQFLEVSKCDLCGSMVEALNSAGGELTCCGQPMDVMREGTTDGAKEKHVPVVEKTDNGYKVSVGSVAHPMEDSHYIEWIELIADGVSYTKFLKPGEAPVAEFCVTATNVTVREYCNLHGLWKA